MAEHIVKLTDAEETYLTTHGSTFDGIIGGMRVEWARAIGSEAKSIEFAVWQKVKNSEVVKNAIELELGAQAVAAQQVFDSGDVAR